MKARRFEDLVIWKMARSLTGEIYNATRQSDFSRDFGLCNQIQRASVSILSNISEGYERGGNQEFLQFLAIAKGSCGEVRAQLYIALDLGYLNEKAAKSLIEQHRKLSIMLNKLMDHLKRSGFKGAKYKKPPPDPELVEFEEMLKELVRKNRDP